MKASFILLITILLFSAALSKMKSKKFDFSSIGSTISSYGEKAKDLMEKADNVKKGYEMATQTCLKFKQKCDAKKKTACCYPFDCVELEGGDHYCIFVGIEDKPKDN